jgi:hypothetical protein
MKYALIVLALFCFNSLVIADEPLNIPYFEERATIDASLDEEVWQKAVRVPLDIVYLPSENTPSPLTTTVLMYESGDTLYVAFIADDPNPENIRARYRVRDNSKGDDNVGIRIDPHGDGRLHYRFFVNPLGVQSDIVRNEITRKDNREWDAIWQSAGKITDKGFQVEVALPLNIMNFSDSDGIKHWRMSFDRVWPREQKLWISNTPRDRSNSCQSCQLSDVYGFEHAKQADNLFIIPSLVLGKNETRDVYAGKDWSGENNIEPSLDVQWGITPEVTLQATLNPDFSQVEADDAQLSINNNFALFFPEKRPFFLANQEYFNSLMNLVYTRNFKAPDYGLKLTGHKDGHTFGVFVADDVSSTLLIPGNLGSSIGEIAEPSTNLVGRYRYDMANGMSLGYVTTQRKSDHYKNAVHSIDFKYEWDRYNELNAQWSTSDTEYPADFYRSFCGDDECATDADYSEAALRTETLDSLTGDSWKVFYNHNRRDWFVRVIAMSADPDFRADLGFEPEIDRTKYIGGAGYHWYSDDSWWHKISLESDIDITHTEAGEVLEQESEAKLKVFGQYDSDLTIGFEDRQRRGLRQDPSSLTVDGNATLFDESDYYFFGGVSPTENIRFKGIYKTSDKIDYANNRLGQQTTLMPGFELMLGRGFRFDAKHNITKLKADGSKVFTAKLTDIRLSYQFDIYQTLKLIAIHSDITRNQANYYNPVEARSRDLGLQLLYSYNLNPLTKFYVGYSEASFSDDTFMNMISTDRSVFMKISYAYQP